MTTGGWIAALTALGMLLPSSWAPASPGAPGRLAACPAPSRAGAVTVYLKPSAANMLVLLPPPPAPDSPAQQADVQAVIEAQRNASAAEIVHAVADSHASCARFADVLGGELTARRTADVIVFLDRAAHEAQGLIGPAKDYWKRSRPYIVSGRIRPLGDVAPGRDTPGKALERAHSSYPSGHATFGTVCAILLADMVPEKRSELFARAADFGHSRLVLGAHFPSDVAAGRLAGTVAAALLMRNTGFHCDYLRARTQLRAALGLPPMVTVH